jgi:hypothetical protein
MIDSIETYKIGPGLSSVVPLFNINGKRRRKMFFLRLFYVNEFNNCYSFTIYCQVSIIFLDPMKIGIRWCN